MLMLLNEYRTKLVAAGVKEEYPPDILHYLKRPCLQLDWWEILTCYFDKMELDEYLRS